MDTNHIVVLASCIAVAALTFWAFFEDHRNMAAVVADADAELLEWWDGVEQRAVGTF